ncbi:MAG TPA: SDR family NAD(P)-dependent oxidoreductase [Aliidongia sp.]|uniref:SDR family NAD(P)-dependent oxidoreductase n=1 Tax=Aliidongia sp. TaxID=1914230 RepID=UPI002DDD9092|nr:SDR family NAD(P)-dependent oxidoreductase [Aliidongia sp.]HEV2675447.1 SDR family NAD(P)-dependent oxidoreductase [Aliidongia sp.]
MARLVWITGASTGIGHALAVALARDGWTVAASARDADALRRMAAESAGRVHAFPLDVTDEPSVITTLTAIEQTLGPIDLALFAAGTHLPISADHFDTGKFRKLVEVNLMGVVNCLGAVLPGMIARRAGQIAIISSVAGYFGLPTAAAYGATKSALITLAEALKFDCDRHGIAVSIVNPGFVKTPLTDKNPFPMPFLIGAEEAARRIIDGLATKRFEIAFPRRFVLILKLIRLLPYRLFFPLVARGTRTG